MSAVVLQRYGSTAEVASAALFLASDAASYITGSTIVVDGGGAVANNFPSPDAFEPQAAPNS